MLKFAINLLIILTIPTTVYAQPVTSLPSNACSGEDTFGKIVQNAIGNSDTGIISTLFVLSTFIGVVGVILGIRSLLDVATNDGRNATLSNGLLKIFGGSLLAALPFFATIIGRSFFGSSVDTTVQTNTAMNRGSQEDICSQADTVLGMYENFVRDAADPLTKLAYFAAIVIGLYLVMSAVQRLMQGSAPNSQYYGKFNAQILRLSIGALFINIQPLLLFTSSTFFSGISGFDPTRNFATDNILGYKSSDSASNALEQFCNINDYIYIGLIPFGIFAVISGLRSIYLNIDGSQQSSIGGGAVKIIAGVILVNMELFANAVVNTINPSASLIAQSCGV